MNPHPEPGVVADVVLDGGWRRNVTVIGGADPVLLRPIEGPATLPGTLTWCPACLEWRDGHRAARLNGMLTHAAEGFALTPIGSGRTLQRRRFVRVAAEVPAALVAHDQRVIARTINLSLGGMLVADAADLRIDEPLQFALDVGSDT
uniref:PilZ domain-containing protein n=1 Tax=Paraconexibacter sp. TaxID=2949640 RepID=UPI0035629335